MVEGWELKSVERRIDSLEKSIERDRERAAKEKEEALKEAREEERRESKRRSDRIDSIMWTLYVIALTTILVLALTDKFHHH